jgi:hypothetical protein
MRGKEDVRAQARRKTRFKINIKRASFMPNSTEGAGMKLALFAGTKHALDESSSSPAKPVCWQHLRDGEAMTHLRFCC